MCGDCHTMHQSLTHDYYGFPVDFPGGQAGTLKNFPNPLCLECHDGHAHAPDVLEANFNDTPGPAEGRSAGALKASAGYGGHQLGSTAAPPGWDPAAVGAPADWYEASKGLRCIDCHAPHGESNDYRNLGPPALGAARPSAQPRYVIGSSNSATMDVWIRLPSYTAGTGNASIFNPYYATATVTYNRNDATVGATRSSNRLDVFCATCHGRFHGGPGDASIGGTSGLPAAFLRHPTSQAVIGGAAALGQGTHSSLSRFIAGTARVRVYASQADLSDATPGCISCHKAHGNRNPFALIFLGRGGGTITEQGTTTSPTAGLPQLCGQCHEQGA